jgi:hypothetical protein
LEVRALAREDVETVLELGQAMHAESALKAYPFAYDRAKSVFEQIIGHPDVFAYGVWREGSLAGAMIAEIVDHLFVGVRFAKEVAIYVLPNARGAFAAKALDGEFRKWAAGRADIAVIEVSAGISDDRSEALFSKFGYVKAGTVMRRDI